MLNGQKPKGHLEKELKNNDYVHDMGQWGNISWTVQCHKDIIKILVAVLDCMGIGQWSNDCIGKWSIFLNFMLNGQKPKGHLEKEPKK